MPPVPEKQKDKTSGDMTPFIIFMAFVILTTVIVISIYRMKTEEDALPVQEDSGFTLSLRVRDPIAFSDDFLFPGFSPVSYDPIVFSDDFLFPGFFPVSREAEQSSRPNIERNIVEARRLMAGGDLERANDILRTLLLFYPDDIEVNGLFAELLRASGRTREAEYYDERLSFLLPSPMPETIPSASPAPEKRTGP